MLLRTDAACLNERNFMIMKANQPSLVWDIGYYGWGLHNASTRRHYDLQAHASVRNCKNGAMKWLSYAYEAQKKIRRTHGEYERRRATSDRGKFLNRSNQIESEGASVAHPLAVLCYDANRFLLILPKPTRR